MYSKQIMIKFTFNRLTQNKWCKISLGNREINRTHVHTGESISNINNINYYYYIYIIYISRKAMGSNLWNGASDYHCNSLFPKELLV